MRIARMGDGVTDLGCGGRVSEQQKNFPEFYVTSPAPCPYLAGRLERKLFTHLTRDKPAHMIDNLLRGGFRRSQSIAYVPYCEGCNACVSVRVPVDAFRPGKSLRRTLNRNRDITAVRVDNVPTSEQYAMFRDYVADRHGDGGMADMSVLDFMMMIEDSSVQSSVTEYRVRPDDGLTLDTDGELVAAALVDRLSDGLSLVYSFFDTEAGDRSLGTYMVLEHIAHARRLGLPYVYLGYWIDGSPKMAYKARFRPQERLTPNGWVAVRD